MFWFHCGRCGALFQSPAGEVKDRLCPNCGGDPSLGILEAPLAAVPPGEQTIPGSAPKPDHQGYRSKRSGKKRTHHQLIWLLGAGWLCLLALIVLGARLLWHEEEPAPAAAPSSTATVVASEDRLLLNKAISECAVTLSGFLAAGTPEARNQFVLTPVTTAARMARFDSLNPWIKIETGTLSLLGTAALQLPGAMALETHWKTKEDKTLDAVFREEAGEWRLDWDQFVRYSDYPWLLFLAGSGPAEGEFRLLARQRLAEENQDSKMMSVVFYAPRFGYPGAAGFQSPEFLIAKSRRDGQLLAAAFTLARQGKRSFGATLPSLDPEGMIRVRVKIRRTEVAKERGFELIEVRACHWYSVDDPGVAPPAPAEAPTQDR